MLRFGAFGRKWFVSSPVKYMGVHLTKRQRALDEPQFRQSFVSSGDYLLGHQVL